MNEQELRAMIRESIARHLGAAPAPRPADVPPQLHHAHPSHVLLRLTSGGDACLIEPAVRCTHCGYCKSFGH